MLKSHFASPYNTTWFELKLSESRLIKTLWTTETRISIPALITSAPGVHSWHFYILIICDTKYGKQAPLFDRE